MSHQIGEGEYARIVVQEIYENILICLILRLSSNKRRTRSAHA